MARVNLPQIAVPQKLLKDRELRSYFENVNFVIYQLWKRTGGGTDDIAFIQDQIDQIVIDVSQNTADILANAMAIAANVLAIAQNALNIAALQQTFSWKTVPSGETVTIGVNQQMLVADGITIDGLLVADGELHMLS